MQLKKLLLIALKDLKLIFRDPSALVMMLVAPFVLTIGMGALTGRFSGSDNSSLSNILVVIVNEDEGLLGETLVDVFQSPELDELVDPVLEEDFQKARGHVDNNQVAGAIYVPPDFTASIFANQGESPLAEVPQIEFYANPTLPNSVGVLRSIVDQFINQVEVGRVSATVIVTQLIENGILAPQLAAGIAAEVGQEVAQAYNSNAAIRVQTNLAEGTGIKFDILAYMAPGMAIMFLMFTVTYGGRSLLVENRIGTLPRLLVAPTRTAYVLGGKMVGIYLTAIAQLAILIGGTSLLFRLQWGDPLGVVLLILAAAIGATGWGLFFASVLKTPGQVAVTGSAVMLLFGLLGGSFFDISMLPDWISVLNKITPNAWAIEGFRILSFGGKLKDIQMNILALVIMGAVLFTIATFLIHKRGLAKE